MEPPKKVQIFHKTYDIEYHEDLLDNGPVEKSLLGDMRPQAQVIRIVRTHPEEMEETLLHEVLHAISHSMRINFEQGDEESIVSLLSVGLMTVLKQNKWVLGNGLVTPKKRAKKGAKA